MLTISAWLGIIFGVLGAVLEIPRNWGHWEWWPFWTVDYVSSGLLIAGGSLVLRGRTARWLAGGWGFACAMFWMSFFGHYGDLMKAGVAADPHERRLTTIIGVMFLVTIVGLLSALFAKSRRA
jgi:hypothetical protein